MKKIYSLLLPTLILLTSFLLRLSLISKGPYHVDCLNLALKAQETLDTGVLQNLFGSGYPLTVILGALFIFVGRFFSISDPVIMVNFMSVVFSSFSILALYFFTKKLFNTTAGIFTSILFSITPIFLSISVYGKSHAPSIFFLLIFMIYLFQYKEKLIKKDFLFASIFYGLMGACRLQDMILIAPAIVFSIFSTKQLFKQKILACLNFFAIAGTVVAIFHLPYLISNQNQFFKMQFSIFWYQGVAHSFRGLFSPALEITFNYFLTSMTLLGLIISFFGLFFIWLKNHKTSIFFILWFLIPILFYGNLWTITPRLFAFCLIPLFIAQGFLLSKFFAYKNIFKIITLSFFLFTGYISLSLIYPPLSFRHKNDLLPQYAKWVKKVTENNAVIILGGDHGLFMTYYGNLNVIGKPSGRFHFKKDELLEYKEKIDSLINRNKPVYISFNDLHVYDFHNQFATLISNHYTLEAVGGNFTEFWHKGSFNQIIFYDTLFKINPK